MSDENRRVAVVLFVEVHDESADAGDAAHRAECGLKAALAGDAQVDYDDWKWRVSVKGNDSKFVPCDVNLTVHEFMEVGMAMGNGYLWSEVTCKAFPRDDDLTDAPGTA
jgi:hypothetical protein